MILARRLARHATDAATERLEPFERFERFDPGLDAISACWPSSPGPRPDSGLARRQGRPLHGVPVVITEIEVEG